MAGIANGVSSKFYAPTALPKGLVSDVNVLAHTISIREALTQADTPISSLLLLQAKDLTGAQLKELMNKMVEIWNENKTLLNEAQTATLTFA